MLYDYKCNVCGKEFEVNKPMSEYNVPEKCPVCSGETTKVVAPVYLKNVG